MGLARYSRLMVSLRATISVTATASVDETVTEFCSVQIFCLGAGEQSILDLGNGSKLQVNQEVIMTRC